MVHSPAQPHSWKVTQDFAGIFRELRGAGKGECHQRPPPRRPLSDGEGEGTDGISPCLLVLLGMVGGVR